MALVHELENSGNWLFKRRGWLPVSLLLAGLVMMFLGNRQALIFDVREEIIYLSVSVFGELIRIFTVGFAPKGTSGRNTVTGQIAEELNVTGLYSLVRHPLYAGNFFMWLGPVLFLESAWFTVVFCLVYWIYYERIMFAEEQFLRRKFGEAYDIWSEKVSAVIPFTFKFIPPAMGFSVRDVLKREYNSIINMFIVFAILDLCRNYILTEKLFFNEIWLWCLAVSAGFWLVVFIIHKFTSWLDVRGR